MFANCSSLYYDVIKRTCNAVKPVRQQLEREATTARQQLHHEVLHLDATSSTTARSALGARHHHATPAPLPPHCGTPTPPHRVTTTRSGRQR